MVATWYVAGSLSTIQFSERDMILDTGSYGNHNNELEMVWCGNFVHKHISMLSIYVCIYTCIRGCGLLGVELSASEL